MSNVIYNASSPDDVHEEEIRIPRDTDLPLKLYAKFGDDCPGCSDDELTPYDFTGHTIIIEIFECKEDTTVLLTIPNSDFTLEQTAEGVTAGVFDIAANTILWSALSSLNNGQEYWYRYFITDASSNNFVPQRGPFIKEEY